MKRMIITMVLLLVASTTVEAEDIWDELATLTHQMQALQIASIKCQLEIQAYNKVRQYCLDLDNAYSRILVNKDVLFKNPQKVSQMKSEAKSDSQKQMAMQKYADETKLATEEVKKAYTQIGQIK